MKAGKYKIDGKIINTQTGKAIPHDEPIFIIRARDKRARAALLWYRRLLGKDLQHCENELHAAGVLERVKEFYDYTLDHPDLIKEPDA